ncbi:response regulator [Ferviditalea candida]|uniref:Response regulator n=1 Tax=Ferviditalea candida TaxID=3108399 RepID=A0ABU5ZJZ8_9BACL|nr:response regulator [Paenibacillaceae bacterium T2]
MKKALVVDDMMFMRMTLKNTLEKNGFMVAGEADNGIAAVEKYKELQPDLVTLDITMPVMDGLAALREIKRLNKDANIIMVSALGQESMVMEAMQEGAKGFIVKPFKEDQIIRAVSKFV